MAYTAGVQLSAAPVVEPPPRVPEEHGSLSTAGRAAGVGRQQRAQDGPVKDFDREVKHDEVSRS